MVRGLSTLRVAFRARLGALVGSLLSSMASGADAGTASFQGLGDLPGGPFMSHAFAVSDDGTTVVGQGRASAASSTGEAFRWTNAGGMVGLGPLGEPVPLSLARDVSADGAVVIGEVRASAGAARQPFRWSAATGMAQLTDPTGEMLRGQAFAVSGDGAVVTGVGASVSGNQAFRWTPQTGIAGIGWVPNNFHDSFGFGISTDGQVIVGDAIAFAITVPGLGGAAPVHAAIYGVDGRLVRTLLHAPLLSGTGSIPWDGTDAARRRVAAGSYVLRAQHGPEVVARHVVLVH